MYADKSQVHQIILTNVLLGTSLPFNNWTSLPGECMAGSILENTWWDHALTMRDGARQRQRLTRRHDYQQHGGWHVFHMTTFGIFLFKLSLTRICSGSFGPIRNPPIITNVMLVLCVVCVCRFQKRADLDALHMKLWRRKPGGTNPVSSYLTHHPTSCGDRYHHYSGHVFRLLW